MKPGDVYVPREDFKLLLSIRGYTRWAANGESLLVLNVVEGWSHCRVLASKDSQIWFALKHEMENWAW